MDNQERPTGVRLNGLEDWAEYEETPLNHETGYFWRRCDGLRVGCREAGMYYRSGTEPGQLGTVRYASSGPAFHDGAIAIPLENMIESGKREYLPWHIRFVKDGKELELLTAFNGMPASEARKDLRKILEYADKKWPYKREFVEREFSDVKEEKKKTSKRSKKKRV